MEILFVGFHFMAIFLDIKTALLKLSFENLKNSKNWVNAKNSNPYDFRYFWNSARSDNPSLKYQRFTPPGWKDIGTRKVEFVTMT